VLRNKRRRRVNIDTPLANPLIREFADVPTSLLILLIVVVPILDSPNRWFTVEQSLRKMVVLLVNAFLGTALLYREVAARLKGTVVASIPLLLHLAVLATHYIGYAVDQSLVLVLHVVSFEVRYTTVLVQGAVRVPAGGNDGGTCLPEMLIVASLVLEVDELLTALDIH
jgi:hypothetical protein